MWILNTNYIFAIILLVLGYFLVIILLFVFIIKILLL